MTTRAWVSDQKLLMLPMSRWRGRLVRSLFVLPLVAVASFAAGRHQRTGRPGLRGAWRRPYWDIPIDRSVPPTMKGDVFHDGHRDRCAHRQSTTQRGDPSHRFGSSTVLPRQRANCSTDAELTATVEWKLCASSNVGSPMSYTEPCSPTKPPHFPAPLDRGARGTRRGCGS